MPILLIDHESSDATPQIAARHRARVERRPFAGFVEARRYALSLVQTPWTLMIDADEALDETLREALLAADGVPDGYLLSRTTFYCGRALRMWSGERLLRFFRTDRVRLEASPAAGGSAQLHERWIGTGTTADLPGVLLHYSYPNARAYREKFEAYTSTEAAGVHATPAMRLRAAARVPLQFLWYAFVRGALLDGADGLRVAWWSARYPEVVLAKALRRG